MSSVRIAVDAAGGDFGCKVTLPGCQKALAQDDQLELRLSGPEAELTSFASSLPEDLKSRVQLSACEEFVAMHETAASALRRRRRTSLGEALAAVADGDCSGCVSSGNTGALVALARFILSTLPGIDRPAICSMLPSRNGWTHLLDLGANVNVTAEMLTQFAVMGSAVSRVTRDLSRPRVALLNIGTESIKGNDAVRQADQLLRGGQLNYTGFAEGHDIFLGDLDVVVCDGFAGNVALKTSEGLIQLVFDQLKQSSSGSLGARMAAAAAQPALKLIRGKFDPRLYNGASLVGLMGVVVKSHGASDAIGFANAVAAAATQARANLSAAIGEQMVDEMNAEDSL